MKKISKEAIIGMSTLVLMNLFIVYGQDKLPNPSWGVLVCTVMWMISAAWILSVAEKRRIREQKKRRDAVVYEGVSNYPHAIKILIEALSKDKTEGSTYYAWQSNIAMSLYDVISKDGALCDRESHKVKAVESCNEAAKNFLDMLITQIPDEQS